jgi:alcohol dehydrogenase
VRSRRSSEGEHSLRILAILADLRATVRALHEGAFGTLEWLEERRCPKARGRFPIWIGDWAAAAKVLLVPSL